MRTKYVRIERDDGYKRACTILCVLFIGLSACSESRQDGEVGLNLEQFSIACKKYIHGQATGMTSSGKLALVDTSDCVYFVCVRSLIKLGKYASEDRKISETELDIKSCLGKNLTER